MTEPAPVPDFQAMRLRNAALGKRAYARFLAETETLTDWMGFLRSLEVGCPPDELLAFALRSDELCPTRWSESRNRALSPEIALSLDGASPRSGFDLTPQAAYVLGRSAMRETMRHPAGSRGLTSCFGWLRNVDGGHVTLAGADDEFLEAPPTEDVDRAMTSACREIASHPQSVLDTITGPHGLNAIFLGADPISPEACVGWRISRPVFGLDIGRIILLVARTRPGFAIECLESLGNAALIAAALQDEDYATDDVLTDLVTVAPPAFNRDTWTGAFSTGLLLDAFEKSWIRRFREQLQASGRPPDLDLLRRNLRQPLDRIVDAVQGRPDGNRILLEWTAHALTAFWGNLSAPWRGFARPDQFQPERALAEELLQAVRAGSGNIARAIWSGFGGSSEALGRLKASELPAWIDAAGRKDAVTPFLLASLACQGLPHGGPAGFPWRIWLVALVGDLENQPRLGELIERRSGAMAGAFSLPIADDPDLTGLLGDLWETADWLRTRARFASDEDVHRLPEMVEVIPWLGVRALGWVADRGSPAPEGALRLLADMVDEMRYTVLQPGWHGWSGLVCDLARVNSAFGRSGGALGLADLFRRYHGDDDALAAAAVGASNGGSGDGEIRQALAFAGVELKALGERWSAWNDAAAADTQGKHTPFANVLARLVRAGT